MEQKTKNTVFKKKFLGRLIFFTLCAVVLYFLFGGPNGLIELYHLRYSIRNMETELKQSKETIDSLSKEISMLKNDTAYIEKIAREKLGMAGKNEKIYKFIEEQ